MEHCRAHEIFAIPLFHLSMIRGGGELNFPTACDDSNLLKQHEIFLARERDRPEVEIAAFLKKLSSHSQELGVGFPPGIGGAKTRGNREKFEDPELGGARVDDNPKEKGGENDRGRV